ncbi:MAG: hypothetical protein AAB588_06130 [Patescibacteria group bacterium]
MDFFSGKTNRYAQLILDLAKTQITRTKKKDDKELILKQIYSNVLLDRDGPRSLGPRELNYAELFAAKLFRSFSEIVTSYRAIQNFIVYLNVFPFKKKVSQYDYLKYHIENYLQELYIFRLRLESYLNVVEKLYKKSPRIGTQVSETIDKLRLLVANFFGHYKMVRGRHVHKFRYTDRDIDRLALFDTLSASQDKEFVTKLQVFYKIAYEDISRKWKRKILEDIRAIHALNESYFDSLYKVTTKNGDLVYPLEK